MPATLTSSLHNAANEEVWAANASVDGTCRRPRSLTNTVSVRGQGTGFG
jgi:hypothetical protein